MKSSKNRPEKLILEEKTANLIAIGAATASNCIPCFEHIYEKAITSGLTIAEIKQASEIADKVKRGARTALANTVSELVGDRKTYSMPCEQTTNKFCCSQ